MKGKRESVEDLTGTVCGLLSKLGCEYHIEGDNRGGKTASRYVYVTKPRAMKIRVSQHKGAVHERQMRTSRTLMFDVGPHGLSIDDFTLALFRTLHNDDSK